MARTEQIESTMYVTRFGDTDCEIGIAASVTGAYGRIEEIQIENARCHHCGEDIPVERLSPKEVDVAEKAIIKVVEGRE